MERRVDGGADECERVDGVLFAGGRHREDRFHVAAASGAGGALGEFATDHAVAHGAFAGVIGRFHTGHPREGPQAFKVPQQFFTGAFGFLVVADQAVEQGVADSSVDLAGIASEGRPLDCPGDLPP